MRDSFDAHVLVNRAEAASDAGRYELAQQLAMQAIAKDPGFGDSYASLGRACLGQARYEEAVTHFKKALSLEPTHSWYLRGYALSLERSGQTHEAIGAADELVRLFPESSEAHHTRGKILCSASRFQEAIDSNEEAIRLDPHNADAHANAGLASISMGRHEQAERYLRQALSLEPNSAIWLNNLGVSLEGQKKVKDAALAYKAAIMVDPTLQLAKQNTHSLIEGYLKVGSGGVIIVLLYVGAKLMILFGQGFMDQFGRLPVVVVGLVILFALVLASALLFQRMTYQYRKRELDGADPELLELYETIKRYRDY